MSDLKQAKLSLDLKKYFFKFLKWLVIAVLTGVLCGTVGFLFTKTVSLATNFRMSNGWLIFLLPVAGLIIPLVYKLCAVEDIGTDGILEASQTEKKVHLLLAPAIFVSSAVTHLFGGSAGKEGAALQIGGSMTTVFAKTFKLSEKERHVIIMCGMAGCFSAVFGTPLCAAVFVIEAVRISAFVTALFPCIITSATAYAVSLWLGVHPEQFKIIGMPEISFGVVARVVLIAIVGFIISVIFSKSMHFSARIFKKYFRNDYLRVFVGGAIILLLTVILKTNDYNGAGINVIERIFEEGSVRPEAFLLKIIFTAITLGAGFKGGEIVPTLFVGASLGAVLSGLFGLSTSFGAALGMSALFCGVTNCPIATVMLCLELFGGEGILFYALAAFISFLLSGSCSLYTGQRMVFSKLKDQIKEEF